MARRSQALLARFEYPRLTLVWAVGTVVAVAGAVLWLTISAQWGFRLGFLGAVLLAYAASGFVAFALFSRADFD